MAVTLNLGSKVIYSGESTTLTATVTGKTLTKAVFSYWVDGITSSKVSVNMTRSGATATIDLKTVFNAAYNLDEIEFVYQVEVAYLSKNAEKVTSGNVTTTTTETQTDFSNQQSVIFRSATNKALKVKETTNLEHPIFSTRRSGELVGGIGESVTPVGGTTYSYFYQYNYVNNNAKYFIDNFEQVTAKVDSKNELLPLVDVTHPLASKVRVKTPKGIKAVAQKTANFKNRGGATSKFYGDVTKATTTYSSQISGYYKDTYITSSPSYSYLSGSKANYAPKYYYYSYGSTTTVGQYGTYQYSYSQGRGYQGNDRYYYYYRYYYGVKSYQKYGYHYVPNMSSGYYRYTYTVYIYRTYSDQSCQYYYYYHYTYNHKYISYQYYTGYTIVQHYSYQTRGGYSNVRGTYYKYYKLLATAYGYKSYAYASSYYSQSHTVGYGYYHKKVGPVNDSAAYMYNVQYTYTAYGYKYYYYYYTKGYTTTTSASNGYYITGYTNTYGYKYKHNYGYYYKPTYTNVANTSYSKYYYTK